MSAELIFRRSYALPLLLAVVLFFFWTLGGLPQAEAAPSRSVARLFDGQGLPLTQSEQKALKSFRAGKYLQTRTQAEAILRRDSGSYVAHFLMAYVYRYAEGELMRSLWHLRRALRLYRQRGGPIPSKAHQIMLREEIFLLRQLSRGPEVISLIRLYNQRYRPSLEELLPWTLMKMRRYRQAAALARKFLQQKKHRSGALNTLCALSHERGFRRQALRFCRAALQADQSDLSLWNRTVHLFNVAEAYLGVFQFEQAERYGLEATRYFHRETHTNPWEFLVSLYLDQGRMAEGWRALKEARRWYRRQPPRLAESLYAESRRTMAVFFLAAARPQLAIRSLEKIRDRPDRHGHTSAKQLQQIVGARLLRRAARKMKAETLREERAASGFWRSLKLWFRQQWTELLAWRDGASARQHLAQPTFLKRTLTPYRAGGAMIPSWVCPDLIGLMGAAPIRHLVQKLRAKEQIQGIQPFWDALEAEALLAQGETETARELALRGLKQASSRHRSLQVRLWWVLGESSWYEGDYARMRLAFGRVLSMDGAIFRRRRRPLPVRDAAGRSPQARRLFQRLLRSPRFRYHDQGFSLQVAQEKQGVLLRLADRSGAIVGQIQEKRRAAEELSEFERRLFVEFHRQLFSPHLNLSRQEIFSLDGSNIRSSARHLEWRRMIKSLKP